jgi:MFS family permease
VRPFGALVFGRLGDMIGRKYTFLVTILIMGLSTFIVGILPTYATIGAAAPVILVGLRLLQGLALGGEYGGAATYVAEHAPQGKRGAYTSWIQTTATLGLFLSLMVILGTRTAMGEKDFGEWGWRIPFIVSILLLGISVWIRLSMNESPAFQKMKSEGKTSKAPLSESFGQWKNLKIVLLALFGLVAGQGVVWYTGQFYALFFLTSVLKVDPASANIWIAISLILGTPFFVIFGTLSDKIGRKPIIIQGPDRRGQPGPGPRARDLQGHAEHQHDQLLVPGQPAGARGGLHQRLRHRQARAGPVVGQLRNRRGRGRFADRRPCR